MSGRQHDAVIVGGSVAGAATAALLARRGRRVLVVERARFPREKACGEGLLPPGVAVLERLGLPLPEHRPIRGIRYRVGDATGVASFPGEPGIAVRRLHLDDALLHHAEASGAEVVVAAARAIEPGRVVTDEGTFEGRLLVGADGGGSLFHRALGLLVRRDESRYGMSTHLAGFAAEPDLVEVVFFRGGEVYLAPVSEELTLAAFLVEKATGLRPDGLLGLLRRLLPGRADGAEIATPVLARSPLSRRVEPVVGEGWLLVGDAAGNPDPLTGEGMSLALRAAEAAAETIDEALDGRGALADYAGRLREIRRPVERLTRLVLFAARRPWLARRFVRRPRRMRPLIDAAVGARPLRILDVARAAVL